MAINPQSYTLEKVINRLKLHEADSVMILKAIHLIYGRDTSTTFKNAVGSLKKFGYFAVEKFEENYIELNRDILIQFHSWLLRCPDFGITTKYMHFRTIARIINYCYRNNPKSFPNGLQKVMANFGVISSNPRATLIDAEARRLVGVLHEELVSIEERLKYGITLMSAPPRTEHDEKIQLILRRLLDLAHGDPIKVSMIKANGKRLRREVNELGGAEFLMSHVYPSQRDILIFYLIILFQLAGNAESILFIKANCVSEHSLRDDRVWIKWDKPRSSREQRANFPRAKEFGAPQIIARLNKYTARVRELAQESEKDLLFIAASPYGIKVPKPAQMHLLLAEFIKKHDLPKFTFSQLRKTSAVLHHKAGQTILSAKKKLNHKNVATTLRYTTLEDRQAEHHSVIFEAQQHLISDAMRGQAKLVHTDGVGDRLALPASTVFGFKCTDPTGPYSLPAYSGGPCVSFSRCATCPGALIPLVLMSAQN